MLGADVDADGDTDVVGVGSAGEDVGWWENQGGDGVVWVKHVVAPMGTFSAAVALQAADLDRDGDLDIQAVRPGALGWWENASTGWTQHPVDVTGGGWIDVAAGDVDGDGELDLLGAAQTADDIVWWKSLGGQFALATVDTAPGALVPGGSASVFTVDVAHRGRNGDTDTEVASAELRFDDGGGGPLTSGVANALVEAIRLYRDGGNGVFDGSDTLLAEQSTLSLDGLGTQTIALVDGDPNAQVSHGADGLIFVVLEAAAGGGSPNTVRVTHVTEASSTAEDASADIELDLEYVANVASGTVSIVGCGDGVVGGGEECDDGNLSGGDCCSSTCTIEASGTVCRAAVDACDAVETCDGATPTCPADEFAASGAFCGDTGTECVHQDTCDGAGACTDNGFVAPGTSCGDASDTECTDPDTCDGAGACLSNHVGAGTFCGAAGTECKFQDVCSIGVCFDAGFKPDGLPCDDSDPGTIYDMCAAGVCVGVLPPCGNGWIEGLEECDDGGVTPGDGCGLTCTIETGYACTGEPSVCEAIRSHYMEYKAKESDKKAVGGALAKGCVVTLDDPLFDFADGETTAENYELSKVTSLGLPADKNDEGGVDLSGTHLLSLKAKASKEGVLSVTGGKFPKGRKHVRRLGVELTIPNPTFHDGSGTNTIRVDTTKVTRVLVPANKDHASVPVVPTDPTDHYKCYKARASKVLPFGTLQDAKGKELKNLQVVVGDQFGDGNGHPTYSDARLFDILKVSEVCNPVTKTNVDTVETDGQGETRETTCTVTPASVAAPQTSLLCWKAKVSSKAVAQPWDGVSKGTSIDPKQGKHGKHTLKTGNPLYVGHQLTAPDRVDTNKELHFCFPAQVTDVGTPVQ